MEESRTSPTFGDRVKSARKLRGFRTPQDLVDALPGGNLTAAVVANIESNRKITLDVSQLLNLALALEVPPIYLLTSITEPGSAISISGLSSRFDGMTSAEFDGWLSGTDGSYEPSSARERRARASLGTFRDWAIARREANRLERLIDLSDDESIREQTNNASARLEFTRAEIARLSSLLKEEGWLL